MEWSDVKTVRLIDLYRLKPELWDPKNDLYKNRNKRHDALSELSEKLEVPKDKIERKTKNLLGQFTREIKKTKEKKSGSGAEDSYESKWFAFKLLFFWKDRNNPRSTINTVQVDDRMSADEVELSEEVVENLEYTESREKNETRTENSTNKSPAKNQTSKKDFVSPSKICLPKNKRKRDDVMAQEAYKIMKTVDEKKSDRDEYALFGEQVACKLRKLSSDRTRSNVQKIINTVLSEAECGFLENYGAMRSVAAAPHPVQNYPISHFASSVHVPSTPIQNFFHTHSASSNQNPNSCATLTSGTSFIQNPSSYPYSPSLTLVREDQSPSTCTPMTSPSLSGYSEYSSENEEMQMTKIWST